MTQLFGHRSVKQKVAGLIPVSNVLNVLGQGWINKGPRLEGTEWLIILWALKSLDKGMRWSGED